MSVNLYLPWGHLSSFLRVRKPHPAIRILRPESALVGGAGFHGGEAQGNHKVDIPRSTIRDHRIARARTFAAAAACDDRSLCPGCASSDIPTA